MEDRKRKEKMSGNEDDGSSNSRTARTNGGDGRSAGASGTLRLRLQGASARFQENRALLVSCFRFQFLGCREPRAVLNLWFLGCRARGALRSRLRPGARPPARRRGWEQLRGRVPDAAPPRCVPKNIAPALLLASGSTFLLAVCGELLPAVLSFELVVSWSQVTRRLRLPGRRGHQMSRTATDPRTLARPGRCTSMVRLITEKILPALFLASGSSCLVAAENPFLQF